MDSLETNNADMLFARYIYTSYVTIFYEWSLLENKRLWFWRSYNLKKSQEISINQINYSIKGVQWLCSHVKNVLIGLLYNSSNIKSTFYVFNAMKITLALLNVRSLCHLFKVVHEIDNNSYDNRINVWKKCQIIDNER